MTIKCTWLAKRVWQMPTSIGNIILVLFHEYVKMQKIQIKLIIILLYLFCSVMREAEANKLKLTPQFLELKFIEAIADNTKIFFGDKVAYPFSLKLFCLSLSVLAHRLRNIYLNAIFVL